MLVLHHTRPCKPKCLVMQSMTAEQLQEAMASVTPTDRELQSAQASLKRWGVDADPAACRLTVALRGFKERLRHSDVVSAMQKIKAFQEDYILQRVYIEQGAASQSVPGDRREVADPLRISAGLAYGIDR